MRAKRPINRNSIYGKYGGMTVLFALLISLAFSCGSSRSSAGDYEELRNLVNSKGFVIENQWAQPMRGSMIDLIGNPNYIRFRRDSVRMLLPYFGVRHSGGDYGGRGGIQYNGPVEDLDIKENEEKNRMTISFEAEEGSENYDIMIQLYSSGKTTTSVNSSERDPISYTGSLEALDQDEKL